MKCQDAKPLIFSYLDEHLSGPLAGALYAHLSSCPHCQQEMELARQTHSLLEKCCTQVDPPQDLTERIMLRLSGEEEGTALPASSPPRKKQPFYRRWQEKFGRQVRVASLFILASIMSLTFFANGGWQIARNPIPDLPSPPYKNQGEEVIPPAEKDKLPPEQEVSGGEGKQSQLPGTLTPNPGGEQGLTGENEGEENAPSPSSGNKPESGGDQAQPGPSQENVPVQQTDPGEMILPGVPDEVMELTGPIMAAAYEGTQPSTGVLLDRLAAGDVVHGKAVFAGDGGKIKYLVGDAGEPLELWEMEADGKNPRLLGKTAAAVDGDLNWSPDGEKVAYVHRLDGRKTIYVDDFSGQAVNLTPLDREDAPEGWAFAPVWSRNGEVAYLTNRSGNLDIMVANRQGSRLVAGAGSDETNPVWSPDGKKIAFQRDGQFYIAGSDGSGEKAITPQIQGKGMAAAWSADGKYLAVSVKGKTDQQGIWLARTDGSEWKRLVQIGGGADVVWSPDSRKVAFTDPEGMVYILTVTAGGQKGRLYSATPEGAGSRSAYLAWSPDSRELLLEWTPGSGENRGLWKATLP